MSDHPYQFRTGTWACIYDIVTINGRPCYFVAWEDWVFDYWVIDDPVANYQFRDCELTKNDPEPEARAPGESDPVG